MMLLPDMLARLREKIGNPSKSEVDNEALVNVLVPQLEWLVRELRPTLRTETQIALTASEYTTLLPSDCVFVLYAEHNDLRLEPASVSRWVSDRVDWQNATAGTPRAYAVQGRTLLLNPPPSSSAITTDGYLKLVYLASSPGVGAGSPPDLTDGDLWCAIYRAGDEWLGLNPGVSQEMIAANASRQRTCAARWEEHFRQAKQQAETPVPSLSEGFRPARRRTSTAR